MLACFASACQTVLCKGRQYTSFCTWTKSSPKRCSCLQSPNIWAGAAQAAKLPLKICSMVKQPKNGLKPLSSLAAGAVNQSPSQPPHCGWGRADLPTVHGKQGQAAKKARVALEVIVACREALLKHFMPVFRWYENSFPALNPPTSFPAGGKGPGTMKRLLPYPSPKLPQQPALAAA